MRRITRTQPLGISLNNLNNHPDGDHTVIVTQTITGLIVTGGEAFYGECNSLVPGIGLEN